MTLKTSQLNNILTYLFLFYVIIGPSPFLVQSITENSNASGGHDLFRQIFLSAIFLIFIFVNKVKIDISANIFFIIFLLYSSLSIAWSDFPFHSIRRTLLLFIVFGICYFIVKSNGGDVFIRLFNVLLVVQCINIFYLIALPSYSITELGFKGLHIQKNTLGVVCIFAIFVSLSLMREVNKSLAAFLICTSVLFLILSGSKTNQGLLVVILAPLLLGVIWPQKAKLIILSLFGIFVLTFFLSGLFPNYFISNYASFIDNDTLTGRGTIWLMLLDNIEKNPYFGYGYGGFWGVGEKSLVFLSEASWLNKIGEGHNGFLDLLVNLGVAGLFIYLAIIIKSLHMFSSQISSNKNIVILCLYLYVFLHNFTESSLVNVVQMVWVLFIIMSMYFVRKEL